MSGTTTGGAPEAVTQVAEKELSGKSRAIINAWIMAEKNWFPSRQVYVLVFAVMKDLAPLTDGFDEIRASIKSYFNFPMGNAYAREIREMLDWLEEQERLAEDGRLELGR